MEMQDWIDIVQGKKLAELEDSLGALFSLAIGGILSRFLFNDTRFNIRARHKVALTKMIQYNKKDVLDTEGCLVKVLPYIKLKMNASTNVNGKGCITCGSLKLVLSKVITKGQTKYQQFECLEHEGYAGKATIKYDRNRHKVFGSIQG